VFDVLADPVKQHTESTRVHVDGYRIDDFA
jgi:hypothetical protein